MTDQEYDQPQRQNYDKLPSTDLGILHSESQQSSSPPFPSSEKEEFVRPEVEHLTEKVTPMFEENVPYDRLNLTKLPFSSQGIAIVRCIFRICFNISFLLMLFASSKRAFVILHYI